jgi:hypothetical protein
MNLFGFEIRRKADEMAEMPVSFTPQKHDDGAIEISSGGAYGTYVDLDGSIKTESELVTRYRDMSMHPELEQAIDDIVNEAIVTDHDEKVVSLVLDDIPELSESVKKRIRDEFEDILSLFEFNSQGYELFRRWYIDGRLYFHLIIDEKNPRAGIQEIRYIDPRKIRKIRETKRKKPKSVDKNVNITVPTLAAEYYIYNEKGFDKQKNTWAAQQGLGMGALKIAKDSVLHTTSGMTNLNGDLVLSYLHKAIKPLNQLRALEDATVIYRISRAPERRIFYIDVGNLPKIKAEQYLRDVMTRFKNKVVYDASTGEIRDDRKFMSMLEDFWLPRREGGKGTEITTLPAGQNLGELEDVLYFQRKLFRSLNVPISRMEPESTFNFGRATEISRDEIKFAKFITRLRNRFSLLFLKTLERQLILKNIITSEDWKKIYQNIKFDYARDNYFDELKNAEIMRDRVATLRDLDEYAGKYYSHLWIRKNVLHQDEDEIKKIDAEIETELDDPKYNPPEAPAQAAPAAEEIDVLHDYNIINNLEKRYA